ncbi:MAG: tetratricopeptide repeat protein [Planctomycetes bacterium]|jgi:tetratricopeptide (TPR) repeat protein|nr:tetratricopeptide repeat protein [Planctomycetota bacterium]
MDVLDTHTPDHGWTQHYELMREMGDCYTQLGEFDQARRCYEKAAALEPDEDGPYVGTGVIALQEGRLDDAELAFRVALRLNRRCSRAWAGLAMIRQQRNALAEAFECYLKSLDLNSDNLTALLGLFQVSCQMGSFERVIDYLNIYLDKHPGDTAVMFCLATLYVKEHKPQQARQLLESVLIFEPNNDDARNLLEEVEHMQAQTTGVSK